MFDISKHLVGLNYTTRPAKYLAIAENNSRLVLLNYVHMVNNTISSLIATNEECYDMWYTVAVDQGHQNALSTRG